MKTSRKRATPKNHSKNVAGNTADMALNIGAKRLHTARQFMYDGVKKYHNKFINPKTGLCKQEYLETRNCPVCGSNEHRDLFIKDGGQYVICQMCGMVFLNPVFTDESLAIFYSGYPPIQAQVTANESDFSRMIYGKGVSAITKFNKSGALMDVGCSSGMFLDIAKEKGWKTVGVELNQAEAAEARKKHEVYVESIQSLNLEKRFDVISMWDVLEHIKDGGATLRLLAKKYLRRGGLVFLQIPNVRALAVRMMQEKSKMFDGIEHVNLYGPKTIALLAKKSGFDVAHLETVISEIPIVANYLDYQDPYLGEAEHHGKVLGLIDEKKLHKNLLGYKMQIVLRLK